LERGEWLPVIHREHIVIDLTKLQQNRFIIHAASSVTGVGSSHKLEILD
jgi:hypothetical protein